MDKIVVKVTKEKNWAGNEYLIYSTEEHGKIAELDYPNKHHKTYGVWQLKAEIPERIGMSCLSSGLVGAETVTKGYFLDRGYNWVEFNYPKTIKTK